MDMNGALKMASSRIAITAALGLALGAGSAQAADLGGNCCADLEERVAELEATTARKGNRKMSLTVTGQVNRLIMWYNDGDRSDVYYGLDNTNSSSRFTFLGEAKVTGKVKIGFDITIEHDSGASSSSVTQIDEDAGGTLNNTQAYSDDPAVASRRIEWWIEHKDLGRLTVGRQESAGVVTTIDLGGIGVIASSSVTLLGAGMYMRGDAGEFYAMQWSKMGDPADAQGREEQLRYDSPLIHGFIFSATVGEAGDQWGAMLRYAGEFSGFRVAAGIGYESIEDPLTVTTVAGTLSSANKPDLSMWGGSLAVMHVPSGVFVQGQYMDAEFGGPGNSAYWGDYAGHTDSKAWQIQAGIRKNWFGIGDTSLYGEYNKLDNWGAGIGAGKDWTVPSTVTDLVAVNGVTDTELTVWGLGIVQNVDAAATELYLGWRHYSADVTCNGTGAGASGTNCAGEAGSPAKLGVKDLDIVAAGARVKF
jgi:hypothetical protein